MMSRENKLTWCGNVKQRRVDHCKKYKGEGKT